MRTALALLAVAFVLTACGTVAGGAAPSPTPSTGPGLGFDLSITEKDHTATMRAGQKLELVLHAYSGMTTWSGVRSSDTSILMPIVNPAATAVRGVTLAAFQAVAPGTVEITAVASPDCSPGQACPALAMLYRVTVTVTS